MGWLLWEGVLYKVSETQGRQQQNEKFQKETKGGLSSQMSGVALVCMRHNNNANYGGNNTAIGNANGGSSSNGEGDVVDDPNHNNAVAATGVRVPGPTTVVGTTGMTTNNGKARFSLQR